MAMTALISCNKEDNNSNTPAPTPPSGQVEENFNVIYRVGHRKETLTGRFFLSLRRK